MDAARDEALRRGDAGAAAIRRAPRERRRPAVSGKPSARFAFCTAWPAAPFPRLSIAQMTIVRSVARSPKTASSAASVPCTRTSSGVTSSGSTVDRRRGRVRGLEQLARLGRADPSHVARGDEPAAERQQVGDEADRKAEGLLDLGLVLVCADLVRGDVLEHDAGMGARLQALAGARDPGLRVDDDARRVDGIGAAAGARAGRPSHNSPGWRRGARPAAAAPGWRSTSSRARRRAGGRSRTSPHRRPASFSRCAPERSTTTPRGRRLELRRPLVVEADEDEVGAASQRLLVRNERGRPAGPVAGEAGVESARGLPGERVRAEREQVELGVREDAVERLLPGVAGSADDGRVRHCCVLCS